MKIRGLSPTLIPKAVVVVVRVVEAAPRHVWIIILRFPRVSEIQNRQSKENKEINSNFNIGNAAYMMTCYGSVPQVHCTLEE